MKKQFNLGVWLGIPIGFALATVLLFGSIVLWEKWFPLPYRIVQPVSQPASIPADLGELTARVENLENDQNFNLKAFEWKVDQKLLILGGVAFLISFFAGLVGIKTYNDLEKVINEEVRRSLDKTLYHLDPTNLRIWVVSFDQDVIFRGDPILDDVGKQKLGEDKRPIFETINSNVAIEMLKVGDRILLTGLRNLKKLDQPDHRSYDGVTVVPVFDRKMEEDFVDFLQRNKTKLDPKRAAFVLYTRDHFVSQTKTLALYPNLATANMLPTVASMILTVGRGLSEALPANEEKKNER